MVRARDKISAVALEVAAAEVHIVHPVVTLQVFIALRLAFVRVGDPVHGMLEVSVNPGSNLKMELIPPLGTL